MNWVSSYYICVARNSCGRLYLIISSSCFSCGLRLTGESTKPSVKCWQSNGTLFQQSARAFSISEGGAAGVVQSSSSTSGAAGAGAHHHMFVSDYTVRALTDVTYLRVSRFIYQAARSATLLERAQITSDINNARLSIDSAITATVDSSQLTSTSSHRYSNSCNGSLVDAPTADHLKQQEQHNQESSTCSGDTISTADPSS